MMTRVLLLLLASAVSVQADASPVSVQRLDILNERGYFTPAFRKTAHDLVNTKESLKQVRAQQKQLQETLPDLQKQSADAALQITQLRKELAIYEHPEDADLSALEQAMKTPGEAPEEQLKLAQAFIWSYPSDPRQSEAEEYLRQIQKQITSRQQAVKDSATARMEARARLVQRAQARSLSLEEWQGYLRDMSQEELLKQLGPPSLQQENSWIYSGNWTLDPATNQRTGLQISFNGTRVQTVSPAGP